MLWRRLEIVFAEVLVDGAGNGVGVTVMHETSR